MKTTMKLFAIAMLSGAALAPAAANMTSSEQKALLAAGCTIQQYPNPTGKFLSRAPAVYCSPETRVALEQARQAKATGLASVEASSSERAE